MRNEKKTQGFTLIELLIVIAIIGILAAVLIPNLMNARSSAFNTAAQSCARSVSTALEVQATESPFKYQTEPTDVGNSCEGVDWSVSFSDGSAAEGYESYTILARHGQGSTTYTVSTGTGVVPAGDDVMPAS